MYSRTKERIIEIIRETTVSMPASGEPAVDGDPAEVERHASGMRLRTAPPSCHNVMLDTDLRFVDCHFLRVVVGMTRARKIKDELRNMLIGVAWLGRRDINFIEAGAELGDETLAFLLFGLGEALGFWKVLTPRRVLGQNLPRDLADRLASRGYVTTRAA